MSDWNTKIVEEFRANQGVVGGTFDGWDLLLLHHVGARSGKGRVSPLAYQPVESGYAIFASKGGSDTHPDWYHNLIANPETKVEVGPDIVSVVARVTSGEEREMIWSKQKQRHSQFADYEARTARPEIPVLVLDRI
jgi:deazaflavin-dependent oxidoreductase (nitroreductase family)